jgi:hypothetical protein
MRLDWVPVGVGFGGWARATSAVPAVGAAGRALNVNVQKVGLAKVPRLMTVRDEDVRSLDLRWVASKAVYACKWYHLLVVGKES